MTEKEQRLLVQLEENLEWPHVYMFKFILKQDQDKIDQLHGLFKSAEINFRQSSKGTYYSFTAKEMMLNAMNVIERYREVGSIGDIMAL